MSDPIEAITNRIQKFITQHERYFGLSITIAIVSFLTILIIGIDECRHCFANLEESKTYFSDDGFKTYWIYGKNVERGYLKHVFKILNSLGYKNDPNATDWDLLWAHDYPFRALYPQLNHLKPHQKVNHFPGSGYITNKVDLAVSHLKYIPRAFRLPQQKNEFVNFAKENPNITFVLKDNNHRNIKVKKIEEIDLSLEGSFVQSFVDKPLLVDGHKFDIGIYTIITSIDPLRIYIYNGDALLRFCPEKYHPFDPTKLDKYVIGDDYLPIWKIRPLHYYYNELGFGMRESLNAFLKSKKQDPSKLWKQIEDAIRTIVLSKEQKIVDVVNKFPSKRNFFELMRFDFVVDEDLNVFLLEANMSPNLSSAHYPPNQLLYEQVLYNVMSLIGLGERVYKDSLAIRDQSEEDMIVADKNLATYPKECNSGLCKSSCVSPVCQLCKPCLSEDTKEYLVTAYKEHVNRGDCKRIFPPTIVKEDQIDFDGLSPENQLQYKWFVGKCQLDDSWC